MKAVNKFELVGEYESHTKSNVGRNSTALVELVVVRRWKSGDKSGSEPICVKMWGECADNFDAASPNVGDKIKLTGRLSGREYNGRVYSDIVANDFEIEHTGQPVQSQAAQHESQESDDYVTDDEVPF